MSKFHVTDLDSEQKILLFRSFGHRMQNGLCYGGGSLLCSMQHVEDPQQPESMNSKIADMS